jgi:hypothetical protein
MLDSMPRGCFGLYLILINIFSEDGMLLSLKRDVASYREDFKSVE